MMQPARPAVDARRLRDPRGRRSGPASPRRAVAAVHGTFLRFLFPLLPAWFLLAASLGCSSVNQARLRWTPANPLDQVLQLSTWNGAQPSTTTQQVLRRYGLEEQAAADPAKAAPALAEHYRRERQPLLCYALAELHYVAGSRLEKQDKKTALDHYWQCVALSYEYLFNPPDQSQGNPFDPHFRRACDLYNSGLERCLRIAQATGGFQPGKRLTVGTSAGQVELAVVSRASQLSADDFDHFEFVNDYEILGLKNHYRNYGLGVALTGIRRDRSKDDPREKHYPKQLAFPLTAFLRIPPPQEVQNAAAGCRAELELYDPLEASSAEVCGRWIPLESDLTTPLARFLGNREFEASTTHGVLRPGDATSLAGLYMVQPFQPGKIPVVMVHGFWSNPMAWMEMFNDLRSQPEIRSRYQFWFYMYPSGLPFWHSSEMLRRELARVRNTFDPERRDAALDQTVLVGHSMGGLISRMQTIDGGEPLWSRFSTKPFDELKARPELKEKIREMIFFRADPSIKRVVSIASPHRGSEFANSLTQFVGRSLIALPVHATEGLAELLRDNPAELFRDAQMLRTGYTSIDSLSPQSPVLPVLLDSPKPPWVRYHNVVGKADKLPLEASSDGVVMFTSAHLEEAVSEIAVESEHRYVPRHPLAILEVRRILLEHLAETAGVLPPPPAPLQPNYGPAPQALPSLHGWSPAARLDVEPAVVPVNYETPAPSWINLVPVPPNSK